jgi:DNA-binding PadR family transcriptional regulator
MDVATLCLAVLAHGPASGYEIKKELEDGAYSHFFRASFGSIYPALARLAQEGFVTGREQEQAKRPDKKVYRLTPGGKRELSRRLHPLRVSPGPVPCRAAAGPPPPRPDRGAHPAIADLHRGDDRRGRGGLHPL